MSLYSPQLYLSPRNRLFVGKLPDGLSPSHGSAGIVLSLEGAMNVSDAEGNFCCVCRSILVPAGAKLKIRTFDYLVAVYFLDYPGQDFFAHQPFLQQVYSLRCGLNVFSHHRYEEQLEALFRSIYREKPSSDQVFHKIYQLEKQIGLKHEVRDRRVKEAIDLILSGEAIEWPIAQLAMKVGLSVPRLTQLFRQVTGINIRRFKIWQRVYLTSLYCANGMPLTDAAVKAGFCDYAHFSNCFTEMTGVNPSLVLSSKFNTYISASSRNRENLISVA